MLKTHKDISRHADDNIRIAVIVQSPFDAHIFKNHQAILTCLSLHLCLDDNQINQQNSDFAISRLGCADVVVPIPILLG